MSPTGKFVGFSTDAGPHRVDLWSKIRVKVNISEKMEEAISLAKAATYLVNNLTVLLVISFQSW